MLHRPRPSLGAFVGLLLAACMPHAPIPPGEFGVHVASAKSDTTRAPFTVQLTGHLQLGIRARIVAMRPDSSLLLSTPADLVVNEGLGTAVLTAADSAAVLVVTPLDPADSARATVRGHAVRVVRADDTRHVTASPANHSPPPSEVPL